MRGAPGPSGVGGEGSPGGERGPEPWSGSFPPATALSPGRAPLSVTEGPTREVSTPAAVSERGLSLSAAGPRPARGAGDPRSPSGPVLLSAPRAGPARAASEPC